MKVESKFEEGQTIIFVDNNRLHYGLVKSIGRYSKREGFDYFIEPLSSCENEWGAEPVHILIKECNIFITIQDALNEMCHYIDQYNKEDKYKTVEYSVQVKVPKNIDYDFNEIPLIIEDTLCNEEVEVICTEN